MFYGIMWFDARGIRPVPPLAGAGRGGAGRGGASRRAGRSPGRGPRAGGGWTVNPVGAVGGAGGAGCLVDWGTKAGPQEALSPPRAPAPRGLRQRRLIPEEAAAPAGGLGNGVLEPAVGAGCRAWRSRLARTPSRQDLCSQAWGLEKCIRPLHGLFPALLHQSLDPPPRNSLLQY